MGKLIVLEGTDGSGKSTQFSLLKERLTREGTVFRTLVFPRYNEPSSALIKMYLGGDFGAKPGDVNGYAASIFYAVDRYASYRMDWKDWYAQGGAILSDRYTTSNAVHQGAKVPEGERSAFFRWLYDLEFDKMGLPRPDLVIYLDMPTELTEGLMRKRESDFHTEADIHEKDLNYLRLCRRTGLEAAQALGWQVISCAQDGAIRSIEDIHEEIYRRVTEALREDGSLPSE